MTGYGRPRPGGVKWNLAKWQMRREAGMTDPTDAPADEAGTRAPLAARLKRHLGLLRSGLAAFLRAPGSRRMLALEAARELARARGDTRRPGAPYARGLSRLDGPAVPVHARDEALAAEIGAVVAAVAAAAPFRALCLEQALAVRRMLARRGVPAVLHIGMARDSGGRDAHAWVTAGDRVVSGHAELGRFTVIARYS